MYHHSSLAEYHVCEFEEITSESFNDTGSVVVTLQSIYNNYLTSMVKLLQICDGAIFLNEILCDLKKKVEQMDAKMNPKCG